jgi:outer membrane receptor protein involved in Fe transport
LVDPKKDWNNFSPEVTLSYQYNDDVMFFASYREGFKSGGYDMSYGIFPRLLAVTTGGALDNTYNEENVDGFEVGMKSTLLDGTLRFNVTAYTFAYEDLQLSKFDGQTLSFSLFNAGKASVDGLEVETLWVTPAEGLTLTANLAWGNSEFDEFIAPCWAGQTIAMGCGSQPSPITGNFLGSDRAGDNLPFASDLSATLGVNYVTQVSHNWNLAFNLTASFKDDYNPIPGWPPEDGLQDSFWWVNAGVSLYSSDDRWELFFRGVNLTDEVFRVSGGPSPGQGDAAFSGTNDPSGLPDWIAVVQGGQQINVGVTYRM